MGRPSFEGTLQLYLRFDINVVNENGACVQHGRLNAWCKRSLKARAWQDRWDCLVD